MDDTSGLLDQLRARIVQDRLSEAEFTVAVAEIVASSDATAGGSALLVNEIRELERMWRASQGRAPN